MPKSESFLFSAKLNLLERGDRDVVAAINGKMNKKTPKNSNKKSRKAKNRQENTIILGIFLLFILVVACLFYFMNIKPSNENAVAIVNGNEITRDELDWWYDTSVLPEARDVITKQDFLNISLIPQEILMQKAKKEGIAVTEDEVEKLIGLFMIENGLTLNEFEEHLQSRGISIDEIKKSFETRATIIKLFEKENIYSVSEEGNFLFDPNDNAFQEYMDSLINSSNIKILSENIYKLVLKRFEATNDKICNEEKPVVRMYTTSWCEVCNESSIVFENAVKDFVNDGNISAVHWSLDTGDNLLTSKKENGVPQEEIDLFKKYSPDKLVPAVVLGCKYKYVGKLSSEDEEEFKAILKTLII